MERKAGTYERLGNIEHYIPDPLPPKNPPFEMSNQMTVLYGNAMQWLSKLDEMAQRLPNNERFIKAYVIKEALLSSAIEGIHTTLLDVFTQPLLTTRPNKETQLVINYTKALDVALELMQQQGLPISNRVILQAHGALMESGQGEKADPGRFRKQSVRVGPLIPAPANIVPELMKDLEQFINDPNTLPPLVKAGLAHVQFETIHPFLDGNGRIGRLLIVLMLIEYDLLQTPILYPSYYFKKYHMEYYQYLNRVRTQGDFEGWITFYLKAIEASSRDAYQRAQAIEQLEQDCKRIIEQNALFAKKQETALKALAILFQYPIISVTQLAEHIGKSYNTVNQLIGQFETIGWLQEETAQQRNKLYRFKPYIDILEKEFNA